METEAWQQRTLMTSISLLSHVWVVDAVHSISSDSVVANIPMIKMGDANLKASTSTPKTSMD